MWEWRDALFVRVTLMSADDVERGGISRYRGMGNGVFTGFSEILLLGVGAGVPRPILVGREGVVAREEMPVVVVAEFEQFEVEVRIAHTSREHGVIQIVVVDGHIEIGVMGILQIKHPVSHRPVERVVLLGIRAVAINIDLLAPSAPCSMIVAVKSDVRVFCIESEPFARARVPGFVEHPEIASPLAGNDHGALLIGMPVVFVAFDVDFAGRQ